MSVSILNSAITWARANTAILVAAVVFGVVQFALTLVKLNYVLGLATAVAYAAARWTEVLIHPKTTVTSPPTPATPASFTKH